MAVTLRPEIPPSESGNPGTLPPHCVQVTQDSSGKVTIGVNSNFVVKESLQNKSAHFLAKWVKDGHGNWSFDETHGNSVQGGHHLGSCAMGVAVLEVNGTLVVTEISTGATWDVTGATSIDINGTALTDDIFYTGNSLGAKIVSGGGNDSITVADTDSGTSNIDAGGGDDSVNLLIGNNTFISGGAGNDTIFLNSGGGVYDVDNGESIVDAGQGADTIVIYAGTNIVAGGAGNDTAIVLGGANTISSANVSS